MRYSTTSKSEFAKYGPLVWPVLLFTWCVLLCLIHDPRPLGAPAWAVNAMKSTLGVSEPVSRALATISVRACGLALLGVLLSLCLRQISLKVTAPIVLMITPLLAVLCLWINYGYFPISMQLQLGITSALVGALIGLALRRSWVAGGVLVALLAGLYLWVTSTGISDDLAEDARVTGMYLLDKADDIPSGDEGFAKLLELAFLFAEDNSHGSRAVHSNKTAILALGVILGEERVAQVAKRPINIQNTKMLNALRNRVTLMGRNDLSRHFWVSAGLAILSDENRSISVGIGKELMDATPGGSGFSFVDLMANRAGILLAVNSTKNELQARNLQSRIRHGVVIADFLPGIQDLPEGLSRDVFQTVFGGLGGKETQRLVNEIEKRLSSCAALRGK